MHRFASVGRTPSSAAGPQAGLPGRNGLRIAVLIFGALNAALYAGLMPLWDGFDEPFHYGYVQHLEWQRTLPRLRVTHLSAELARSVPLAPASHLVKRNMPDVITFDEYFRLPESERASLRQRLALLDPRDASIETGGLNYEAHQAPLAYTVMALIDRLWPGSALPVRVFRLRLFCGIFGSLATGLVLLRLAEELNLPAGIAVAALFLVYSSQLFYATVARVGNDWLAVPLFTLLLAAVVAFWRKPSARGAAAVGLALGAGLLTKSSFLPLVPFTFAVVLLHCFRRKLPLRTAALSLAVCAALAAPWYARNLQSGNLSGMQETAGGTPAAQLVASAVRLPWARSLYLTAQNVMWTGNNSSTTFNVNTVRWMLLLLATGAVVYANQAVRRETSTPERLLIAGLLSYAAGLAYVTVVTFWSTRGTGVAPSVWYVVPAFPAAYCLLMGGLARGGRAGAIVRIALLFTWTYVICATYLVKLIPFYSGYSAPRANPAALLHWYAGSFQQWWRTLNVTALAPAWYVALLTTAVVIGGVALAIQLSFSKTGYLDRKQSRSDQQT